MNNNLIPLVNIVSEKRGYNREYFINFFERCNLSCGFCWQDHDDYTGVDDIVSKSDIILNKITDGEFSTINVMGGELFADFVDDNVFVDYHKFVQKIHEQHPTGEYVVNFVTNLVFEKTDRVKKFFDGLADCGYKTTAVSSYDPRGRFNNSDRELFMRNLSIFNDYIRSVSVVMTKQNIEAISGGDIGFDTIYRSGMNLYVDFYSPEKNWKLYRPTDTEIVDFFIFLTKKYPDVSPINEYIKGGFNTSTSCRSSTIILPNNSVGSCKILSDDFDEFDNINDLESDFVHARGCLMCEYYKVCGLSCFLHSARIYNDNTTQIECEFKRFYASINEQQ